jgi:uncharacterized protein (DUF697 family)
VFGQNLECRLAISCEHQLAGEVTGRLLSGMSRSQVKAAVDVIGIRVAGSRQLFANRNTHSIR